MDSVEKAKSCPIIGTRFRASGGLLGLIFAAKLPNCLFQPTNYTYSVVTLLLPDRNKEEIIFAFVVYIVPPNA